MRTQAVPIFITTRDRLMTLLLLLEWLDHAGLDEIYLIDSDSTYPPMLEFLKSTEHTVVRTGRNLGHRAPWLSGSVQRLAHERYFVVTDPDVVPDEQCPRDALAHFRMLLDHHPAIDKVGFGLRIDDLPDSFPLAASVRDWESRFWHEEIEPGVFRANIDTTFALYRPPTGRSRDDMALRTGAPYVARHMPWYTDPRHLGEDEIYYREHADPAIANWERDELPRWKERWLDKQR